MPEYPSAQALLADARLRLGALGHSFAAVVVEGWDDKRLFFRYVRRPEQIVVAGGKRLLLAAHDAADPDDRDRILFVADCDYDVPLGKLVVGDGLFVTTHADIESDLLSLGVLRRAIVELAPRAVRDQDVSQLADLVLDRAIAIAVVLGRLRFAAVTVGEGLPIEDLELRKFRKVGTSEIDEKKLIWSAWSTMASPSVKFHDFRDLVVAVPVSYSLCNGHDLVRSVTDVLRRDFRTKSLTSDMVGTSARLALDREQFERWPLTRRVHRWEESVNRMVFDR